MWNDDVASSNEAKSGAKIGGLDVINTGFKNLMFGVLAYI